jgi:hypothetical protein
MGNQYRSGNGQNEDNNRVHDARALRYLLANNSANNSSFVGVNNRSIVRGSRTTTVQSIHELINLRQVRGNTNTTNTFGHDDGGDHHYPTPIILPTTTTINNYNDNRASSSSFVSARHLGSTLTTTSRGNNNMSSLLGLPSVLYPNIGGQPAGPAALYNNNNLSGGAVGNSSNNSNPILNNGRINNDAATGAADPIRNDDLGRSLSLKRSRSYDQFLRGDNYGQSSQNVGTSSRRRIIPHICPHQDSHNMSSSTSYTSHGHYSGNSVISNMLNRNMMNQAIVAGARQSSTSTTQSHINSRIESRGQTSFIDLPYQSSSTNEPIDINRFLFPPRQVHPLNNFINRRYDPSATSGSSFYTSTTTRGLLGTSQTATPFHLYYNFTSSATGGGGSSFGSTSSGQNHSNNNNNFDFFDSFHREIDDVFSHSTISIQEYARVLPSGRLYRFLAPTLVPVQLSSSVPLQRPLPISDPSLNNYRLNLPPPSSGLRFSTTLEANQYVQTSSTLTRSVDRVRLGGHYNHIFVSNFSDLMAERNELRNEVYTFCEYLY